MGNATGDKWPADMTVEEAVAGKIKLGDLGGMVTVINFSANETSKDSKAAGNRLGDELGTDERIRFISVVDISALPMLMQPMAKGVVKKVALKARENFKKLAADKGLSVPDDLMLARPFLMDGKGKLVKALCAGSPRKKVQLVALDADGVVRGQFEGAESVDRLIALVGELLG